MYCIVITAIGIICQNLSEVQNNEEAKAVKRLAVI